jgi:hypothetical protein
VLLFVRLVELAKWWPASPALTTTTQRNYRYGYAILQRTNESGQGRGIGQRKAEKAEYRRQLELVCEVRRLALEAVKEEIRASGDRVQLYSRASSRVSKLAAVRLPGSVSTCSHSM